VPVNNAGVWLASEINDLEAWESRWDANLELNLLAPADLCREAILGSRTRRGGIIINVTSRSAHRGDDAEHLWIRPTGQSRRLYEKAEFYEARAAEDRTGFHYRVSLRRTPPGLKKSNAGISATGRKKSDSCGR